MQSADTGLIRSGLVSFPISINNSAEAIAHLIKETGAKHVLVGPPGYMSTLDQRVSAAVESLRQSGYEISAIPWPSDEIYEAGPDLPERTPSPYEPDRPTAILHSSGTTSIYPKPIVQRQRAIRSMQQCVNYGDEDHAGQLCFLGHLPPAHMMGFCLWQTAMGEGYSVGMFYPHASAPAPTQPTALLRTMVELRTDVAIMPPSLIESASKEAELVDYLCKIPLICYGGGPLSNEVAGYLAGQGVTVMSQIGSTETLGLSVCFQKVPQDEIKAGRYSSMEPARDVRIIWRPIPGEEHLDHYELLVGAKGDTNRPSVLNATYQGEQVYATGDKCKLIRSSKPGRSDRFIVLGRIDEGIVLSTGEKTNSVPIVNIVKKNSIVRDAVMFGVGRPMNGILIELDEKKETFDGSDQQLATLRGKVWKSVQEANDFAPTHSRT